MKESTKLALEIENQIDSLKELTNDYQRIKEIAILKIEDLERKINDLDNLFSKERNGIYKKIESEMNNIKENYPDQLKYDGDGIVFKCFSANIKLWDSKTKLKKNSKKLIEFVTLSNPKFIKDGDVNWQEYSKIIIRKDNKFFDNHGNEVEGLYIEECPEKIEILLNEGDFKNG